MKFLLHDVPSWYVGALAWFEANAGREFPRRPFDVGLPVKLTSAQKGIWKPAGVPYALSVVQTHKGVYPDQDPVFSTDGTWSYSYHQQGRATEDLRDPQRHFANVALFRNQADGVPVGVVIPSGKGYKVLGLAEVDRWDRGMFTLTGPVELSSVEPAGAGNVTVALVDLTPETFDPEAPDDGRLKTIAEVVRRQGQTHFRKLLLQAYQGRCAMSSYDAEPALEAAHIIPYRGKQTNHPANGLLLRADIHDLFDLGLIAVDGDMRLRLAGPLEGTLYEPLDGRSLRLPNQAELRPSPAALEKHFQRSAVA